MNPSEHPRPSQEQQPPNKETLSTNKKLAAPDTKSVCSVTSEGKEMAFYVIPGVGKSNYTGSHSWKSSELRRAEEFARVMRLVKYVAPEQFRNPARPTNGPCKIVPTNVLEYVEHGRDILAMAMKQTEKNVAARKEAERVMNIKANGEVQKPIKSQFGEYAKVFSDGRSPVLFQPTMWCAEYDRVQVEQSPWPTLADLQECGDRRENEKIATRCGRYMPPPRQRVGVSRKGTIGADRDAPTAALKIKRLLPLDEPGPIFCNGPSPIETIHANTSMDLDTAFEERGRVLLGDALMEEIGNKRERFVPRWLAQHRRREAYGHRLAMHGDPVIVAPQHIVGRYWNSG